MPLFPNSQGTATEKSAVLKTVTALAQCCGEDTIGPHGLARHTGHVFRIDGAQHLAALGISDMVISVMARWDSNLIRHYTKEASLSAITQMYKEKLKGLEQMLETLQAKIDKLHKERNSEHEKEARKEIMGLETRNEQLEK